MNTLSRWYSSLPPAGRVAVGCLAGAAVVATAGGAAYAVGAYGVLVVTPKAVVAVGPASLLLTRQLTRR